MNKDNMINKEEYIIADVEKKILEMKVMEDTPTNRRFVRRICNDIGNFFEIDVAKDFTGSNGYKRIISIVNILYNDDKTKGILKKAINKKYITEEEKEHFKLVMRKAIKLEESNDKIEKEYELKKEILNEIQNIKKEVKERFCEKYDKYIDLLINNEWRAEELKEKICNTNDEIMNILNSKVNDIMYNKELINLINEENTISNHEYLVRLLDIQKSHK